MSEKYNLVTAARQAGVTAGTVRYWILTGRLKAEKDGNFWIIDPEDLTAAMNKARSQEKSDEVPASESTESR